MKLRLIQRKDDRVFLCQDGSIKNADRVTIVNFFTNFTQTKKFTGNDGFWINTHPYMDEVPGKTLAFVDNTDRLVILTEEILISTMTCGEYISVSEYAERHRKGRAQIKRLCMEGRLPGSYKTSSGWLIPGDTPYPERKPRTTK